MNYTLGNDVISFSKTANQLLVQSQAVKIKCHRTRLE